MTSINASGQEVARPQPATESRVRTDASVLAVLFNEQHVVESGLSVSLSASQHPPEARFEALRSWVVPDPSATRFRVTADFAAGGIESQPDGVTNADRSSETPHLVSPAYELIRLAGELNQIDPLRTMIAGCPPGTPTIELDRLTLLTLIALEVNEENVLENLLDQWFKRIQPDPVLLQHSTAGLVLLAQSAIDNAQSTPLIREMVRFATYAYQAEYNRDARLRHLVALSAQWDAMQASENLDKTSASAVVPPQWHLANLERAFEHGNAFPKPLIQLQRGSYRNLSNYGDMLLMFQSPLLGNFSVEATATGFGYREAHLVVGGRWTGMVHDHKNIILGEPRGELVRRPLAPPLNDTNKYGFIRTRIDVQDQTSATWMNGRLIHQQSIPQSDSPWLGVRTNYRVRGGVDDLRITGEPLIPEEISLVDSPQLLGWYDYYQPPHPLTSRISGWDFSMERGVGAERDVQISHPRMTQFPSGSHAEQLLRYLRPFAEDGTIAFEFFHQPGQTTTHPAIGRTVFLLTDQGVKLHELTDGRFERTDLRPDNAKILDDADSKTLPLLTNQWNRVEVIRSGDTITVVLNGQSVCEHPLTEATDSPQFGIFHFADQTALRVRNLTWTGGWPKSLPKVEDQQLADPLDEILAWTSDQPAQSFHHVFDETSITSGAILSVMGDPIETVEATPGGVIIKQTSNDGYRDAKIAPVITVSGDFDATVSFDQIELRSAIEMIATVQLEVQAETNRQDVARIQVVKDRQSNLKIQCLRSLTVGGNVRRSYFAPEPADGSSGRLRLCRRGETIYYLAADNDSNRFRLVGKETFPTVDLQPQGIRLGVQAQGPASLASVRLKELTIRAERLGGVATQNQEQFLTELNQLRDKLPIGFSHDFTNQPATTNDFVSWSPDQKWNATDRGLEVVAVGTDHWTATGLSVSRQFAGDFDITFQFSPTQFPTPKTGQKTQVYLQLELTDVDRTQVSAMLTKNDAGTVFCQMQTRHRIDGEYVYKTIGNQFIEENDRLRLLRRGKEVIGIAGSQTKDSEIVLGSAVLTDDPIIPHGVRLLLHTGGSERTSKTMLQSIRIHAAQTFVLNAAPFAMPPINAPAQRTGPNATPSQPQSLPKQVFDSLRGLFD